MMHRRDLLKGIAGVTATGVLLPGEEIVRRFWRGWSGAHHKTAAETPVSPLCRGAIIYDYNSPQIYEYTYTWRTMLCDDATADLLATERVAIRPVHGLVHEADDLVGHLGDDTISQRLQAVDAIRHLRG